MMLSEAKTSPCLPYQRQGMDLALVWTSLLFFTKSILFFDKSTQREPHSISLLVMKQVDYG